MINPGGGVVRIFSFFFILSFLGLILSDRLLAIGSVSPPCLLIILSLTMPNVCLHEFCNYCFVMKGVLLVIAHFCNVFSGMFCHDRGSCGSREGANWIVKFKPAIT